MDYHHVIENPYRPGAGHSPPFLAGRQREQRHFERILRQDFATENILITGLRGFGKTVLLEDLRKMAEDEGWLWVGNDLSESSSLSEERLALRILTDLSHAIGRVLTEGDNTPPPAADNSFDHHDPDAYDARADYGSVEPEPNCQGPSYQEPVHQETSTFDALKSMYECTPGLASDRLKAVLARLGSVVNSSHARGIILAYDEAQCLGDHAERNEFPMSMLVETIASLQKQSGISPCILVLSGLPQVFDSLTSTRTYTERMFHVMHLDRLSRDDSYSALKTPLDQLSPRLNCHEDLIAKVVSLTGGYPYLIQFFGRELVDALVRGGGVLDVDDFPNEDVMERLDAGLFSARWNRTTNRQRAVLRIIAERDPGAERDFSAQEIADLSEKYDDLELGSAQARQVLVSLCDRGLLYRTRHGRYAFTVPMSETMILRRLRLEQDTSSRLLGTSHQAEPIEDAKRTRRTRSRVWEWFR